MNGYLARVVGRAIGTVPVVRPRRDPFVADPPAELEPAADFELDVRAATRAVGSAGPPGKPLAAAVAAAVPAAEPGGPGATARHATRVERGSAARRRDPPAEPAPAERDFARPVEPARRHAAAASGSIPVRAASAEPAGRDGVALGEIAGAVGGVMPAPPAGAAGRVTARPPAGAVAASDVPPNARPASARVAALPPVAAEDAVVPLAIDHDSEHDRRVDGALELEPDWDRGTGLALVVPGVGEPFRGNDLVPPRRRAAEDWGRTRERVAAARSRRDAAGLGGEPVTISVSIGRIEIQRAAAPPARAAAPAARPMLDDYVRRRAELKGR